MLLGILTLVFLFFGISIPGLNFYNKLVITLGMMLILFSVYKWRQSRKNKASDPA